MHESDVTPDQPKWITGLGKSKSHWPRTLVAIAAGVGVVASFLDGWFVWVLVVAVVVLTGVAILVDVCQDRQKEAETKSLQNSKNELEKLYEQSVYQYLDDLCVVTTHIWNSLTSEPNSRRGKRSKTATARQAALAALDKLIGDAHSQVRANLFVPDPNELDVFHLAENGFCGRGERSRTRFTRDHPTYQESIRGQAQFNDKEYVAKDSGGRYAAYATAPVIAKHPKEAGEHLYAIITVDTPGRNELDKARDVVLLQLVAHLLAITFAAAGDEPSVPCHVDPC